MSVRTDHEEGTSQMNPIIRSVWDTVLRVPDDGVRGDREAVEDDLSGALETVDALMSDGAFGEAADVMETDVRGVVEEAIGSYDGYVNQPTREELLTLVDEMVERLRTNAGETA